MQHRPRLVVTRSPAFPYVSSFFRGFVALGQNLALMGLIAGILVPPTAWSQDEVTIPKSRLEELERKERELDRLKAQPAKPLSPAISQPAAGTPTRPVAVPPSSLAPPSPPPVVNSLPPLKAGDLVEAVDLANHFHQDAQSSARRYNKKKILIHGEIAGFEKPLLTRNYRILLKTEQPETKVICDFYPPDKFNAVFTGDHGTKLVGLIGETRVPLAQTGEMVLIKGTCRGLHDGAIMMSAADLQPAR